MALDLLKGVVLQAAGQEAGSPAFHGSCHFVILNLESDTTVGQSTISPVVGDACLR
jgi:hypothetical protein